MTGPFPEPRVMLPVEGTPINFLVDTGAERSVVTQPFGHLKQKKTLVMGATGSKLYPWTTQRELDLGRHQVSHSFLVIPEFPAPLLGRDLLTNTCLTIKLEDEYCLHENWKIGAR